MSAARAYRRTVSVSAEPRAGTQAADRAALRPRPSQGASKVSPTREGEPRGAAVHAASAARGVTGGAERSEAVRRSCTAEGAARNPVMSRLRMTVGGRAAEQRVYRTHPLPTTSSDARSVDATVGQSVEGLALALRWLRLETVEVGDGACFPLQGSLNLHAAAARSSGVACSSGVADVTPMGHAPGAG